MTSFFLSFFLSFLFRVTRSLRMPALRPASQAGLNAQPQGWDYGSVARHHQANLMVCVVCSCCATYPYREVCRAKGRIESGETLCHDNYPARPITTVSLADNTSCMMDGHLAQWAPGSDLVVRVNRARHTTGGHLLSVVQAVTNTEHLLTQY